MWAERAVSHTEFGVAWAVGDKTLQEQQGVHYREPGLLAAEGVGLVCSELDQWSAGIFRRTYVAVSSIGFS